MKLRDILWKGRPAAVLPESWNLKGRGIGTNVATRLVVSRVASWRTRPEPSTSDRRREGRFKRSFNGMTRLTVAFWPKGEDKNEKLTLCYALRLCDVPWIRAVHLVSESRTRVTGCLTNLLGERNEGLTGCLTPLMDWLKNWLRRWKEWTRDELTDRSTQANRRRERNWLTDRQTDRQNDWLTDWLAIEHTGISAVRNWGDCNNKP